MALLSGIWSWLTSHPEVLIAGFLIYVFLFFLSILMSSPKPGPNPFSKDRVRPAGPVEIDPVKRDAVLKQGFHVKRIPEKLDAIVIGSGMGGLTVANILSRIGKRVLVLEQHDQAGGCLHTFVEDGFEFDVGVHYIGNMNANTVEKTLMDQLTEGQLLWEPLNEAFDVVCLGEPGKSTKYPVMSGKKQWMENLIKMFPKEEQAIRKFADLIKEAKKDMLGMVMLKMKNKLLCRLLVKLGLFNFVSKYIKVASKSISEVLDELTDNQKLKAVLTYAYGDAGSIPDNLSFIFNAALTNHYMYGASFPRGGASEMTYQLIPPIEKAGGKVLVRARVQEIIMNEGRALGVRVQKSQGTIDIYAPLIVSDAGIINTFTELLPKQVAEKTDIYKLLDKKVRSGQPAFSIFVGLNGSAEELGLKAQNYWCFTSEHLSRDARDYDSKTPDEILEGTDPIPLAFVSFPSAKDPTFEKKYPGKSVCTIITFAKMEWFEAWKDGRVKKRGEDYEALKLRFGRRIWDQALEEFPQLKDKDEYFSVGTPLSNQYYLNAPNGEIYGLDTNVSRLSDPDTLIDLRPKTGVPGLVLTGQDVFIPGVSGALFSGILTASAILNRNVMEDAIKLRQKIAKGK